MCVVNINIFNPSKILQFEINVYWSLDWKIIRLFEDYLPNSDYIQVNFQVSIFKLQISVIKKFESWISNLHSQQTFYYNFLLIVIRFSMKIKNKITLFSFLWTIITKLSGLGHKRQNICNTELFTKRLGGALATFSPTVIEYWLLVTIKLLEK